MYTTITTQKLDIDKRAGMAGGGKLFATEISVAMRVRTGQRGEDAH